MKKRRGGRRKDSPARAQSAHLIRIVPPRLSEAQLLHGAKVFEIEKAIMDVVERKHRDTLETAERLVAEQLAPVDAHAARVLLGEIRQGALLR